MWYTTHILLLRAVVGIDSIQDSSIYEVHYYGEHEMRYKKLAVPPIKP